ncbi:MAG: phytanoyl-CoA dioxygenase family protein [Cyanophyceae cyanobacterium]
MEHTSIQLTEQQISQFRHDGFLILENLIPQELVTRLVERIEPLFSGDFETGIYPDEWHWRPGLSLPDATRQMCNVWKCDLTVASVVLSAEIGRLVATLSGWQGARIGQDCLWMKTLGSKEVALHQDATYISYLTPPEMTTCWIPLDDTIAGAGTLEYAKGSHRWPLQKEAGEFHAPASSYRLSMERAAAQAGVDWPEIVYVEIPAGGCVIHHGNVWHGSGKNTHPEKVRRSLSIHLLSSETQFASTGVGYIYGRYKRVGDTTMDESFFPILWTQDGCRTQFLENYCQDALSAAPRLELIS